MGQAGPVLGTWAISRSSEDNHPGSRKIRSQVQARSTQLGPACVLGSGAAPRPSGTAAATLESSKVIHATEPVLPSAALKRLVHLKPELASTVIGNNGELGLLMGLEELCQASFYWR